MALSDPRKAIAAWLATLSPEDRQNEVKLLTFLPRNEAAAIAREARNLIKQAKKLGCSGTLIDAARLRGAPVRVPGMVKSRYGVSYGAESPPTRRWTPPQAVMQEDRYDGMSVIEAMVCQDAPSQTGLQFQHIRETRVKIEYQKPPARTRK